jgi:ribosomal protein S18 acetylase RimI-like enzyme
MNAPIVIREFQSSDGNHVINLWKLCFPNDPPWNDSGEMIARKVAQHDRLFFIASRDLIPVGTVLAGYDGVRGWIYHLATHPDFRRQGIAKMLMQHALNELSHRGCPKVNLQVRKSNIEVIEFYKGIGFTEDSTLSFGRRLDAPVSGSNQSLKGSAL